MKILLITRTISVKEGQGRYAFSLIEELSKKNKLIILAYELEGKDNFFNNPNIEIHQIPDLYTLNSFISPIKYFFQTLKFSFKVDLVHILTDFPYYILFSPFSWLNVKPFLITFHGTYGVRYLDKDWKMFFLKKVYQKAKKIICVSDFTRKEILKKIQLTNVAVINNGVDYNKWQVNQSISKFLDKSILGVGALKERKGYHNSILAIAEVKKKYHNLKYYIIGDQSDRNYFDYLKNLTKEHHLENNIIFLEKISDQHLIKFYHQVDLFLLTPVNVGSKFEGFGLVYLEAGSCGIPTIGTCGCGAEEAIKNEVNGLLVPQNNIEKTAEAILKILDNPQLAKQLGEKGRWRAKEMSWKNITKQYIKIYESF